MAISNLLRSLRVVSGKKRSIQSSVCIPRYFDPFPFPGKDIGRLRNLVRPCRGGVHGSGRISYPRGVPRKLVGDSSEGDSNDRNNKEGEGARKAPQDRSQENDWACRGTSSVALA